MREGLIPHKVTTILRLATTQGRARALTEALAEVFDPENSAVAAFEQKDGSWLVEIYFGEEPNRKAVADLVALVVGKADARSLRFDALAAKDWVASSLEGLKPIRAGRFLVHGAHGRQSVLANDISIEIEASLAFGTGHHGTTRGCLLALDAIIRQSRPARVLDVGTGTGVLAIGAAKALRGEIVAGDIDPTAIEVARQNARQNGVASRVRLYCAPGLRYPLAARPSSFDLIFANILARPLARLSPALAGALSAGGRLVVSGLLETDVALALSAFGQQGLRLERRYLIEGWATLILSSGLRPRPEVPGKRER
jgi:ribosomal protein L11 methyltransferase